MESGVVRRPVEAEAVAGLLAAAARGPAALLITGEPGIGKTTLWFEARDRARELGFRVLSARAVEVESRLAHTGVADLLSGVDAATLADLPPPQRTALDRVLLRAAPGDEPLDRRAVGAALLAVLERLAEQGPVLLAVDDLQWVDTSSAQALAFAVRRLTGPVGVLGTVRATADGDTAPPWLRPPGPEPVRRVHMRSLSLGALHTVLTARLGRSFTRPALVRIHQLSGGNPMYALELALGAGAPDRPLPGSLADLVAARVAGLGARTRTALLAAAALAEPTVELVAAALDAAPDAAPDAALDAGPDANGAVALLEDAERHGVIALDGHRVRFTHPLLAAGVYSGAPADQRRAMHRRLSELVGQPELRARHLALAAVRGDPETFRALDEAAVRARARGAPAAAAELLDLAVGLGGDTRERRVRLAGHLLDAGDTDRARRLLEGIVEDLPPGPDRAAALGLLAMVRVHDDGFVEAARLLERALAESPDGEPRARILLGLSYALVNLGRMAEALRHAAAAREGAGRLRLDPVLGQALSMEAVLRFLHGDGVDYDVLRRARELEDPAADVPVAFRPTVQQGLLLAWTGRLDPARETLLTVRRHCAERGAETDLTFVAFHQVLVECWRGNFPDAALVAEDTMERARQLGTAVPRAIGLTTAALVEAYTGDAGRARELAAEAIGVYRSCGWETLVGTPLTTLGFVAVSLGEHRAALDALEPLLAAAGRGAVVPEIVGGAFLPDAVEALVALGRAAEAVPLVDALERHGARLDRPWSLAVGHRCRAVLLLAEGRVEDATVAALRAMDEHARLPMPFERARTQLLLGQLRRRRRHRDAAATLREAAGTFEDLGTGRWAERARAELGGVGAGPAGPVGLTPSEHQVAELAASGMTNREVASTLYISPKTVEANLARVYRKLGIRSRAELGRRMGGSGG